MKKTYRKLPEFEEILAAMEGDAQAMNGILTYFSPYIESECKRRVDEEQDKIRYETDEYMRRRLETKLISKILDFKIQFQNLEKRPPFFANT